jgi:hypothetical protein
MLKEKYMNKLKVIIISTFALIGIAAFVPNYVALAAPADKIQGGVNDVGGDSGGDLGSNIQNVVNMMLFLLGAIAVVMIVIGGIRYTTSNGDSSNIKAAKDTILYAAVGLIIAIMAYAIVNFVVGAFV